MDIEALIESLSDARAYPWHAVDTPVEVIQTHISVVFLIGREVFKLHKAVDFGFLDFTSLDARERDCELELEVNRELAPGIYRGVVPIVARAGRLVVVRDGELGEGERVVEWAVWMRRLPESATFRSLLARGHLSRAHLWRLAATMATFYRDGAAHAAAHPDLAQLGDLDTVVENVGENFAQLDAIVDAAHEFRQVPPIDRDLLARLRQATDEMLARVRGSIHARFEAGRTRDTHGDLRLEHVYSLGDTLAEDAALVDDELLDAIGHRELLVIDRIEFCDRFRWSDPLADIAFLMMDLQARGAWQLARCFAEDYLGCADEEPREAELLLSFYLGYRATVRAKVAAMAASEGELGAREQAAMRAKAEARTRLALVELSVPRERPCMVLVAGLPGTGKSTLARALRETSAMTWIRADEVRKRLAGLDPLSKQRGDIDAGIYTREWSDRTYQACLQRAADVCLAGGRALVDATFVDGRRRRAFVEAAIEWGVPVLLLVVTAPSELIRERLATRGRDPSDADWGVYEALRAKWSPIDPLLCPTRQIDASCNPGEMLDEALRALAEAKLG